jgi:hypothetical protein
MIVGSFGALLSGPPKAAWVRCSAVTLSIVCSLARLPLLLGDVAAERLASLEYGELNFSKD